MKTHPESPYYDDFADGKKQYQILFKPGMAVQARELTQLQTILRSQIERFGDHVFQHRSLVIPGNSYYELGIPFVKISSINSSGTTVASFEGQTIQNFDGVRAIVKKVVNATTTHPDLFYIQYIRGGTNGVTSFSKGQQLSLVNYPGVSATIANIDDYAGLGSLASINSGVFYVSGSFVYVEKQTIVIDKFSSAPSCHVLLRIKEDIVSHLNDPTLLDPSRGFNNFAAPGADRVSISLDLISLPFTAIIDDNYIEILRFSNGEVQEHLKNAKYSELDKYFARRTYDESGNYIVNGLKTSIREHKKTANDTGVYPDGDISKMVVEVSPGKAYIKGFEVGKSRKTQIEIDKARSDDHIRSMDLTLRTSFGKYVLVSDFENQSISLGDELEFYVFENSSPTIKVASATIISIDYYIGDPDDSPIYKVWISNLSMEEGYQLSESSIIRFKSSGKAKVLSELYVPLSTDNFDDSTEEIVSHSSGRSAKVKYWNQERSLLFIYRHDDSIIGVPKVGDIIVGSSSGAESTIKTSTFIFSEGNASNNTALIFRLPKSFVHSLEHPLLDNFEGQSYELLKELTITTNSSGEGSVSASSREVFRPIEVGTFVAFDSDGSLIPNALFSLNPDSSVLSVDLGGTSSATTITVFANVLKSDAQPKTKTRKTTTQTVPVGSITDNIVLNHADVISIVSIIQTSTPAIDITPNYTLWNGQTDFEYKNAVISRRPGVLTPSDDITITYTYYEHSASGDFFCIDSFPDGIQDTTNVIYRSRISGVQYNLPSCIDFRRSPTSSEYSVIVSNSFFIGNLQYYVSRTDSVVLSANGDVNVLKGIPSETPVPSKISTDHYLLDLLYIPPFTKFASNVTIKRQAVNRYTMNNIDELSKRVDRIEDYITLTSEEQSVVNLEVIDAETGLPRFKTGYVVENFENPFTIARTTGKDFEAAFTAGTLGPKVERLPCTVDLNTDESYGYSLKGNERKRIMLPYTETSFASQPLSSRITNLNPFMVISWDGILEVNPPAFNWIESRDEPTIFETETEQTVVVNYLPCPPPAPADPPAPLPPPAPVVTDPPPLPDTRYGGWYGLILGREGDQAGMDFWNNRYLEAVENNEFADNYQALRGVAREFINEARNNFEAGNETYFNDLSVYELLYELGTNNKQGENGWSLSHVVEYSYSGNDVATSFRNIDISNGLGTIGNTAGGIA